MRTISADMEKVLGAGHRSVHMRVLVKDSGGTFRDLSTYPGLNLVERATWHDQVDENGPSAEVELKREQFDVSLAPFMEDSPLNRGFNPDAAYAALLALGREIKIDWALMPLGLEPSAGDWQTGFHGYVDTIDWGPPSIEISCRDLSAKIQDTPIDRERAYGFAQGAGATKGLFIFDPSTAYALNELVIPSNAKKNGKYFKVTTAGTSGAEPSSWPTTGSVVSGTATFTVEGSTSESTGVAVETVMQQIIDDNLGAGVVTLTTPVSPGFNIKPYLQKTMDSTWQAIRDLTDLFGWDLRYVWDDASSTFKLKLLQPDRSAASPARTFAATDYAEIQQLTQDIAPIRNKVRVHYNDSQDLDAGQHPKRKVVTVEDAASKTKYGTRLMVVAEDKSSQIDTSAEATTFANAMLSDLKEPTAEQAASMFFFPFCALGDFYRFSPNGRHYSTNLDVAVTGYSHELALDSHRTTLTVRGKPSAGEQRWLQNEVRPGVIGGPDSQLFDFIGVPVVDADAVVGGVRIEVNSGHRKRSRQARVEVHASKTAAFTPSSTTLVAEGRQRVFLLADLEPGETYYAQVVPIGEEHGQIIRGLPSAEISFVAGRARPIHLDPESVPGPLPPNGSFEGRFRGAGSPPDLWAMVTGTWATDADWEASTIYDGAWSVQLKSTAVAAKVRSEYFPARPGWIYQLGFAHRNATAIDAALYLDVAVEWYTAAKSLISTSTTSVNLQNLGTTSWYRAWATLTAPSTAAFARVFAAKQTAGTYGVFVDAISLVGSEPWIEPSLTSPWVNWGAGRPNAAYYLQPDGTMRMRGFVKSGNSGTSLFTLPAPYRPTQDLSFVERAQWANGEFPTVLDVQSSGLVSVLAQFGGTNPASFMDIGCTFRAGA